MPYLRTLSGFRDGIRQLAMAKGENALKDILALCDTLRDTELVPLGVALDDQPGACSATFYCKRFVVECRASLQMAKLLSSS